MTESTTGNVREELIAIRSRIAFYEEEVKNHPLAKLVGDGEIPQEVARDFALYLFADSWMWPSMLITMRDQARHPRLIQAIEDNIRDEAGERGDSHIRLCLRFLESVGITPSLEDGPPLDGTIHIANRMSEARIAGWLVAAEMLTLPLFKLARACFAGRPGASLEYLDVHLKVDEDHIAWLLVAVQGLLEEGASMGEILQGVGLGARATLDALDNLFESTIGQGKSARHSCEELRHPGSASLALATPTAIAT